MATSSKPWPDSAMSACDGITCKIGQASHRETYPERIASCVPMGSLTTPMEFLRPTGTCLPFFLFIGSLELAREITTRVHESALHKTYEVFFNENSTLRWRGSRTIKKSSSPKNLRQDSGVVSSAALCECYRSAVSSSAGGVSLVGFRFA